MVDKERKARGWSFERLSEETDKCGNRLSSSYIYRLVTGKNNGHYDPTTKTVRVLMDALNLDIRDVLNSLNMGEYLKELFYEGFNQPIEFDELLLNTDILIEVESGHLKPTRKQKNLIINFVSELYKAVLDEEFEKFSINAIGYVHELKNIINEEKHLIELQGGEFHLNLNIEVMVKKYGYKKEEIIEDIKNINMMALYNTDLSFPLYLLGEDWICEKVGETIIVKEKVSELRKLYRKK